MSAGDLHRYINDLMTERNRLRQHIAELEAENERLKAELSVNEFMQKEVIPKIDAAREGK